MGLTENFSQRSRKIAERFLRTAVVVDDQAYMLSNGSDAPKEPINKPKRSRPIPAQEDRSPSGGMLDHTLNARSVVDSFSVLGMICAVVAPEGPVMEAMRRADIVVLDWLLKEDDSQFALKLLRDLLAGETDRNSLRLVAIYTGEARLEEICTAVVAKLEEATLDPKENEIKTEISYQHGRVVIYAKDAVNLADPLRDRSIAEKDLAGRLVEDFAAMTDGLLPSIAITSLAAVREGEHKILDQFRADLDPAFLTHRVCLSNPDDAERHIVNHVAEELRGLMDNAVAVESPAGVDAVEGWIRRQGKKCDGFKFNDNKFDMNQTITLATKGLDGTDKFSNREKKDAFKCLSAGFDCDDVADLDERLAWIMSFRTVFDAPRPTLWLGSVVTAIKAGEKHLLCVSPRCDCVRLKGVTSFSFLPLIEPREGMEQLVVRLGNKFKRLGIGMDLADLVHLRFQPSDENRTVTANTLQSNGFEFTDTNDERYSWQGELKAEYSQRIAQTFAARLSRVAVDESEWLRRNARQT